MPHSFTAAVIQLSSGRDVCKNIDNVVPLIREAASLEATYIQTPEMSSIVERDKANLMRQVGFEETDVFLSAMQECARTLEITLHIGSLALKQGEKLVNRGFMIDPTGVIIARYDKIHLYNVDLPNGESWREGNSYVAGSSIVVADNIGLSICYDLRFPTLYQALAQGGAQVLTAPSCFTKQTGEAHWHVLQRARAIETGSFMISAAQTGTHEDGRQTYGHSLIVDPWGRVLADAGTDTGVTFAKIDLRLVDEARARIPTLKHVKPFAFYEPK